MATVLIAHASKYGSTHEVAEAIAATLRGPGLEIDVQPAAEVHDLAPYDAVVLGAGLYAGRPHRDARGFLRRHGAQLAELPVAVFGMGPLTLEAEDVEASRHQLEHALAKHPDLHPVAIRVFGGAIVPERMHFPFSQMQAADARDWEAIREWAREIAPLLTIPVREPVPA